MKPYVSTSALIAVAVVAFAGMLTVAPAFADAVADAKAAVAKYAGPQTTWEGPTKAPKPEPGKKIVFLSGDEQNDISHLYGVYIKEAGAKARVERHRHRRERQPDLLARRHEPGHRAEAGRHRPLRGRREPAGPDQGRRRPGDQVRRPARRRAAGTAAGASISSSTSRRTRARSARRRRIGRSPIPTARRASSFSATTNMRSPRSNRRRPRTRSRSARAARCSTTSTLPPPKPRSASRN